MTPDQFKQMLCYKLICPRAYLIQQVAYRYLYVLAHSRNLKEVNKNEILWNWWPIGDFMINEENSLLISQMVN